MNNKTTLLIVNDFSFIDGGASKVAISSAVGLKERGYRVIYFSAVRPLTSDLEGIDTIITNQHDILTNPNRIQATLQGLWNRKAKSELSNLLKTLDIKNTIVHIHLWEKALSSSVIRETVNRGFKTVITLHDYIIACPNGGFYNYQADEICKLKPLSRECFFCNCDSRKYSHKLWRLMRQEFQISKGQITQKVKNFIYLSELNKKVLEPYLPEGSKCFYVRNPVDIEKGMPASVEKNKSFIYIGRLSKEKGCLLLAKAVKELNIDMKFVGDGPLKDEIRKINPSVQITGWLDKEGIKDVLNRARALVFPSLWYETLGLAALEATASGVPVIASDMCAAREVVRDRESGLLFKRGDIEDLKTKIIMLMNNERVKQYGYNAYKYYWDNDFSLENHIKQLEKVYNELI